MNLDLLIYGTNDMQGWRDAFAAADPGLRVHAWPTNHHCDYLIAWAPPAELFAAQPALKAVFSMGAGVDHLLRVETLPRELPLVRIEDAGMAAQMVGYVVWGLVRHLRAFDAGIAGAKAGAPWSSFRALPPVAPTVGLLGYGVLGQAVAAALKPLGCRLRAWSRSPKHDDAVQQFAGLCELDAFLDGLDALVCLLPHTPDTENLLDARRLARLAPGSLLINAGRGSLIVDEDLIAALDGGRPAAALLDVFRTEPLPPTHAFLNHRAITVTPHMSALTQIPLSAAQIVDKIARLEAGQAVGGVVDRGRGY
jgi:glyoxylate/hydroxypyruvate reductase A